MPVSVAFLLGILGILLVPGPTNTLLATSGALVGLRGSFRLIPLTVAGYLSAISLWHQVLRPLLALYPDALLLSKLVACAYLIYLISRMYTSRPAASGGETALLPAPVTPARMFIVTFTNPKAAVMALLVFDQSRVNISEFIVFSAIAACMALLWTGIGRTLVSAGLLNNPRAISRIAAGVLTVFVGLLINSIIGAL